MTNRLADLIRLACQAEALARKPGNVHPGASFADLDVRDFLVAAEAVAPILACSRELSIGRAVDEAVRATRECVSTNANLGICLLLAPCAAAAAAAESDFRAELQSVLSRLTLDDAIGAYRAIRRAAPGGLGSAEQQDVATEPTVTLLEAMTLAADRDGVARQYATGFADIFDIALPALAGFADRGPETAIIAAHLHLMAAQPDTLIARKCGLAVAAESAARAAEVLNAGWPATGSDSLTAFDAWLRADSHRRNPGTTADLTAATLFVALDQQILEPAVVREWADSSTPRFPV